MQVAIIITLYYVIIVEKLKNESISDELRLLTVNMSETQDTHQSACVHEATEVNALVFYL